jgi:hypothetical protein
LGDADKDTIGILKLKKKIGWKDVNDLTQDRTQWLNSYKGEINFCIPQNGMEFLHYEQLSDIKESP